MPAQTRPLSMKRSHPKKHPTLIRPFPATLSQCRRQTASPDSFKQHSRQRHDRGATHPAQPSMGIFERYPRAECEHRGPSLNGRNRCAPAYGRPDTLSRHNNGHAALSRLSSDQTCTSASTSRCIAASSCNGVGVIRRRSVPRGTVG